jgi:hypothetical protein
MAAFAKVDWVLYLGGIIAFMGPVITTSCRSLITKCVGPFEVGKVFSVMGAFQAMVPLAASPIYGFMYKATIRTFPGAFLLFTAALYLVVGSLLLVANRGLANIDRLTRAEEEQETVNEMMLPKSLPAPPTEK